MTLGFLKLGLGMGRDTIPVIDTSTAPSISAKKALREMLARSSVFQTAIGATGSPGEKILAAKEKIFLSAYISESIVRPFAVICKDASDTHKAIGGGASQSFLPSGGIELRLEKTVPDNFLNENKTDIDSGQEGDAEDNFEQFYQGCIAEVNALAGTEGYLYIRSWITIEGPALFESSGSQKNVYSIRMLCNWGIE